MQASFFTLGHTNHAISNMQKVLKNFNEEKIKISKFLLMGIMQIICKKCSAKLVQSVSLCNRLSKMLKVIKI